MPNVQRRVSVCSFCLTYLLDPSPIENAFAKLKAFLRHVRAQTLDAIARALDLISPEDAIGLFTHAGLLNLD